MNVPGPTLHNRHCYRTYNETWNEREMGKNEEKGREQVKINGKREVSESRGVRQSARAAGAMKMLCAIK